MRHVLTDRNRVLTSMRQGLIYRLSHLDEVSY